MAADLAAFRAAYPELGATSDDIVSARLRDAQTIHRARESLTLLCAAHLIILGAHGTEPDDGAGEVSREKIGPKEIEYKTQAEAGWQAFFTRTSYGRLFLIMERRTPAVALSARVYG